MGNNFFFLNGHFPILGNFNSGSKMLFHFKIILLPSNLNEKKKSSPCEEVMKKKGKKLSKKIKGLPLSFYSLGKR